MSVIKIPQRCIIEKAQTGLLRGGLYSGAFGLEIVIREIGDLPEDFPGLMQELLKAPFAKALPIVRLCGLGLEKADASLVGAMLKAFKAYGRLTQVIITGSTWPSWLEYATWIIVKTSSPAVIVPADELWYMPRETDENGIPYDISFAAGAPVKATYFYFNPAALSLTPQNIENFLVRSPHAWCVD